MKKILSIILIMISGIIFSQNVGDFKTSSSSTNSWTTASNWERWNGSGWVAQGIAPFSPATYPGAADNPYAVYITTTNMQTPATTPGSFGDVIVSGTLNVSATSVLKTTNIIISGSTALLKYTSNNINLTIPSGSGIILRNGGQLDTGSSCTGNQFLYIGAVQYAQCKGTSPNFTEINAAGGTLTSAPTATPNPAQPNQTVTLNGLATGLFSTNVNNYTWTGTGPSGFSFNSSVQSPTFVPQYLGTYTFTLTVSTPSNGSDSQSIFVEVVGCPTTPFEIANNSVATFHAGAMRSSNMKWYAWGENHGGALTYTSPADHASKMEVNNTNFSRVPLGATVKFVSGGSSGDDANELVALIDDVYHADYRIVSLKKSGSNDPVLPSSKKIINLPKDDTGKQILTKDVNSFYAGNNQIAIVANGRAYVHLYNNATNIGFGDNGTAAINTSNGSWGNAVRTSSGTIITNFVSVRGDSQTSDNNVFIGRTLDGKIYTWGKLVPLKGSYGSRNYATDITPTPAAAGAKPSLVGANFNADNTTVSASLYVMFDNGELWSMGANGQSQLGDFTTTDRDSWVRVKEADSPTVKYANVKYYSTQEHDGAGSPYNVGYVSMILSDNRLFSFGDNQEGLLGINQGLGGTFNPQLAYYQTNIPPSSTDSSQNADPLDGTNANRTAVGVEAGGHISFITKNIASGLVISIAGHGRNGSLIGNNDSNYYDLFSYLEVVPFPTCYSPSSAPCYNAPSNTTSSVPTKHGITLLKRAGSDNGGWPMNRNSGHTVLESNTKGFVITRITTSNLGNITNPQEGMMVYDITAQCLKIYSDGAWSCFKTAACP